MKKGSSHSAEAIQKMRVAHLDRFRPPVSDTTREKMRQAHFGHSVSPETREKVRQARLGKKHSAETRAKMGRAGLGRKPSPETREKLHQAMLGNKRALGRERSPETRAKISKSNLGRKRTPEFCERARTHRLQQKLPTKMTSIECLLRDEFKKRRLHFEMHKAMFGRFQPDFVFENVKLIVQADGDYWHGLAERIESDHAFKAAAAVEGWSVWRFGEKEIHMHAAACAKAVARFVRCH